MLTITLDTYITHSRQQTHHTTILFQLRTILTRATRTHTKILTHTRTNHTTIPITTMLAILILVITTIVTTTITTIIHIRILVTGKMDTRYVIRDSV